MRYLVTIFLALLIAGFGQARADDFLKTLGQAAYMEADIVYGRVGDRALRLNLYMPDSSMGGGPYPSVVFVHGGGWRAGHRGHFSRQAMYLAANGYVCACIEYRLSGEAKFPAAIEDVKCAVRWMRAEGAVHYKVDPERIAVSGGSAGGHLALLAGTSGGAGDLEGTGGSSECSSTVQLVAAFNPACKWAERYSEAAIAFLGGTRKEVPGQYRRSTPASYLDSADPPMLLLHGTKDKIVPCEQSKEFVEQLKAAGVEGRLYLEEGCGHSWFSFRPYFETTTLALKAFLDEHFKE